MNSITKKQYVLEAWEQALRSVEVDIDLTRGRLALFQHDMAMSEDVRRGLLEITGNKLAALECVRDKIEQYAIHDDAEGVKWLDDNEDGTDGEGSNPAF